MIRGTTPTLEFTLPFDTWERRKTDRFYAEQWRGRQIYQQ